MPVPPAAVIAAALLGAAPGPAQAPGGNSGPTAVRPVWMIGAETSITVTVSPDGSASSVVRVSQGMRVRLTVLGAGTGALHLHGYDIEVEAKEGEPAVFVIDAVHIGRFPIEKHVDDALLGSRETAVLYLEVHGQ